MLSKAPLLSYWHAIEFISPQGIANHASCLHKLIQAPQNPVSMQYLPTNTSNKESKLILNAWYFSNLACRCRNVNLLGVLGWRYWVGSLMSMGKTFKWKPFGISKPCILTSLFVTIGSISSDVWISWLDHLFHRLRSSMRKFSWKKNHQSPSMAFGNAV